MKLNSEYVKFEIDHLAPIEDLWRKTGDEAIRALILSARAILHHHWECRQMANKKMSDFERLRMIFPEIPERVKSLSINMDFDSCPEIAVKFYPKDVD